MAAVLADAVDRVIAPYRVEGQLTCCRRAPSSSVMVMGLVRRGL